jgi:hypothetical protein
MKIGIEMFAIISMVGLSLTTAITVGYGSLPPALSFPPRYQDPQDPNNMTKTCGNLEDQLNSGKGVLPNDVLACFDYLGNDTLIEQGLNPEDKEVPGTW